MNQFTYTFASSWRSVAHDQNKAQCSRNFCTHFKMSVVSSVQAERSNTTVLKIENAYFAHGSMIHLFYFAVHILNSLDSSFKLCWLSQIQMCGLYISRKKLICVGNKDEYEHTFRLTSVNIVT